MRIKMIQSIRSAVGPIHKGEILTVRPYPDGSFIKFNRPYQVIEGHFSGATIPLTHCIVLNEEKTYTEKEWNDMENHYMSELDKETAAKERAVDLVTSLSKQMVRKNDEIEKLKFYLEASGLALEATIASIQKMKEYEKA